MRYSRLTLAMLLAVIACSGDGGDGATEPTPVARVVVSPTAPTIFVGERIQLSATAYDAAGNALADRSMQWSSDASAIANVDVAGMVTASAEGSASITAFSGGKSGVSHVIVNAASGSAPALAKVSGDAQRATVGALLTNPLVVQAARGGAPLEGAEE